MKKKRNTKGHGQYQNDGGIGKVSKADRAAATAAYLASDRPVVVYPARCTCSQYEHAHDAHVEEKLIFEAHRKMRYKPDAPALQRKNNNRARRRDLLPKRARSRR